MWSSGVLYGGNPETTASMLEPWGAIVGDAIWDFRLVPAPFPALRPHLSSAIFTPWDATSGCVSSLQLRAQLSKKQVQRGRC